MSADLCFRSARELAGLLTARQVSAREVMAAHLDRIARLNPTLNAIVSRLDDDTCLALAGAADARASRGEALPPLHGLPIAFKDLQPARGFAFTRGSPIFAGEMPEQDSVLVERLRRAGAIPIGKTNVPEFGMGSHTYNAVFGATRNPYDLTKSAGGSSGGAAVAVATGMLPVADGSDFGGSLRNPGNFNNVVGFRPSVGLVPFAPDPLPLLGYFVNGPIARTVADAAFLLSVMAGEDARDPLCYPSDPSVFREPPDDVRDVRGVRVAWCPDLGGLPVEASVRAVIDARRRTFEDLGCLVEDAVPDLGDADEIFLTVRRFRSAAVHGPLLGTCRGRMKADAIAEIEAGQALGAEDLARAMVGHGQLLERLRRFDARFDFIVCVVNQVAPFDAALEWPTIVDGVAMGSYTEWMKSAYWISTTFRPAISVPAGFTPDGLPVGIQIVGRPRGDLSVLRLAHAFEQATRAGDRRPPEALPVAQPQLRTTIVLHDSLT